MSWYLGSIGKNRSYNWCICCTVLYSGWRLRWNQEGNYWSFCGNLDGLFLHFLGTRNKRQVARGTLRRRPGERQKCRSKR
ncbi:hypothetical protein NC653_031237 [Populus alba x Populus x berolinensis]|nr:hypothetical protein NC653_031237 [Populus alba x Populus x berolinensis]